MSDGNLIPLQDLPPLVFFQDGGEGFVDPLVLWITRSQQEGVSACCDLHRRRRPPFHASTQALCLEGGRRADIPVHKMKRRRRRRRWRRCPEESVGGGEGGKRRKTKRDILPPLPRLLFSVLLFSYICGEGKKRRRNISLLSSPCLRPPLFSGRTLHSLTALSGGREGGSRLFLTSPSSFPVAQFCALPPLPPLIPL